ncbi:MAG: IclR family transcriptional regulator [Paracoccaceae bacterium]|nr:IclR family transcriptional regulator [Paracoccaceae bacterium]
MNDKRQRGRPRSFHDKTEQNTIQSLDRAMAVLERLAEGNGPTLSELSDELGQSPATVYRILVTLQQRDIVESDQGDQTWFVGPKAFLIGSSFLRRTHLFERSRPIMQRLMEETAETANLGVERNGQVMFLSQVETHLSIRAFFPPGTLSPLHASGIGKALLAQYSEERLGKFLDASSLDPFTATTFTDKGKLAEELALTRKRGFALDDEERTPGMRCVAAPIFNAHGDPVAGISVSGPTSRVGPEDVERLATSVKAAARDISIGMGARPEMVK